MTKRFSMNTEGKRKEHIDDLAIAESTLPEEGRNRVFEKNSVSMQNLGFED